MKCRRAVRPKDLAQLAAIARHARRAAKRPLRRVHLHNVVYLAALETQRQGRPLTLAPFYKRRDGARCPALDRALREQRKRERREARRWNGKARVGRLNLPGGWSSRDAVAQRSGLAAGADRAGGWFEAWHRSFSVD